MVVLDEEPRHKNNTTTEKTKIKLPNKILIHFSKFEKKKKNVFIYGILLL